MSTTSRSVASPSTTPSSTPPNSDASTLLFGFLVSALSIFAVFMSSAIIWNRLIARRRAIEAMFAMGSSGSRPVHRPMMWDVVVKLDKRPSRRWGEIMPVAAQECNFPAISSRTTQEQTIPFWKRYLLDRLPPEITYLFYIPTPPVASTDSAASQTELTHGSDIQVSLLIAMPHVPQTRKGAHENRHTLHDMVLATTNVHHDPVSL